MKLESAVKYFSPKSQTFTDSSRATASDSLTGTDLMGAIGMCQSKSPFGMAVYMAKTGVSNDDCYRTIEQLLSYANRTAPKLVSRAAGGKLGKCLVVLSKLAFEEYSRSADTTSTCQRCSGTGFNHVEREVVKYAGHVNSFTGEEVIPPRTEMELVKEVCQHCNGKGQITARCRCNGTGRVRDMAESARQGAPVERECDRCSGRGYKRSPGTRAYRAIHTLLPELQERTWNNNWRPFFEKLVAKCEIEESHADAEFRKVTR
ncbi:antitermination protein [Erwinia tracheiphila]|uniref:Antitermination protein n=1 Tax=Erwinia tracheiphila TaxID=65700 RepID=A0A345CT63_9GAMM|nr:antitermination protein [Erwinia tracheiphila]AXF76630.1 antitermination protein [Erwinia tracheiphila]UIA84699.1 antitermination protein [Erwinia tracheiphila]UIA93291.1 antitermination protein [Erwinia tracheiphila]